MEPERRSRKSGVRNSQIQRKRSKRGDLSDQRARRGKELRQYIDETIVAGVRIQKWPSKRLYVLARNFGDEMVRQFSPPSLPVGEYTIRRNLAWCFLCQLGGNEPGAVRSALRTFVLRNE